MFGMGFTEILIIAVIAILFLGPDKLPETMVEIAKFFKNVKKTVGSAKESLEHELKIADIKEEALNYKKQLSSASAELERMSKLGDLSEEFNEVKNAASGESEEKKASAAAPKPEVVTFAKKEKKEASPLKTDTPSNEASV
jgi:sec-independent protein translocase protein TatB